MTRVLVLYYSSYGHIERMAEALAEGAGAVESVEATIKRVPELMPEEVARRSTILSFHTTLLHQGMVIVGLPYSCQAQMTLDEISDGSPYGATTIAASDGSRQPSENELGMARLEGEHVARIAQKLAH